jgi:hypothetical protein
LDDPDSNPSPGDLVADHHFLVMGVEETAAGHSVQYNL